MAIPGQIIEDNRLLFAKGHRNRVAIRKFGTNPAVSASGETVWSLGGDYTGFVTSPAVVSLVSDDANDAAAGTGARTVMVVGLDADGLEQQEIVALDGVTPVTTTATFFRCWRLFVVEVGAYGGANAGNITASISGNACSYIPADGGQSRECVYTVPANKDLYVTQVRVSAASGKPTQFDYLIRLNALNTADSFTPWRIFGRTDGISGSESVPLNPYAYLPPLTDIKFRAFSSGGGGVVSAAFDGILVRNLDYSA